MLRRPNERLETYSTQNRQNLGHLPILRRLVLRQLFPETAQVAQIAEYLRYVLLSVRPQVFFREDVQSQLDNLLALCDSIFKS